MVRDLQRFVLGVPGFSSLGPFVAGHFAYGVCAGLEDEQTRPAVPLDLQTGLDGLYAQVDVLLCRRGLDAQVFELVAILGVVVGPDDAIVLSPEWH